MNSRICPCCKQLINNHSSKERKVCHDKLSGYKRSKMALDKVCVIEVGSHTMTYFIDNNTRIIVCSRHKLQYDERDDVGPFDWERLVT